MTGVTWTAEEDELLKQLVEEHGTKKWAHIATKFKGKGSKQCRRRWKNFLNMNAKNCSWSAEEDDTLVQAHRRFGNKWTEISKIFGDRTDNAVKNRWAALVRKNPALGEEGEGGSGGGGGSYEDAPSAKRQRTGDGGPQLGGAFHPYMPPQYGADQGRMLGHYNGLPVTSMPTPFDQQVVLNPQQQAQLQALQAAAAAQPPQEPQAPLSIMVNKDILNPFEMTLVQQINQAHAPVHIEVTERPQHGMDVTAELVTKRSSWRQFVDSLEEEPQNQMSDILAWFNNASAAGAQLTGASGRRLTRGLSKMLPAVGADSLTDDHRNLLVRLMSKGLEYRTMSEQAEMELLGLGTLGFGAANLAMPPAAGGAAGRGERFAGHRADPMRRTRSSRKSQEFEQHALAVAAAHAASAAAGHGGGGGGAGGAGGAGPGPSSAAAAAAQGDALLNSGFPGFNPAAAQGGGGGGGGTLTRRTSWRQQQQHHHQQHHQQQPAAGGGGAYGDILGDVLLTPTFTSQEIAMLIDALTPGGRH